MSYSPSAGHYDQLKGFRPMLAAKINDLSAIRWPLLGSMKIDGLRVICHPILGPVTRSLKPVANHHIRKSLLPLCEFGFDGEVIIGLPNDPKAFQNTTGAVRRADGEPDFSYYVFDSVLKPNNPYWQRLLKLKRDVRMLGYSKLYHVAQHDIYSEESATQYYMEHLKKGYEGIILRCSQAPYKFNRSTLKQQYLLKLKEAVEAEAIVIGMEPLMRNHNVAITDELGFTKRTSHQSNKVADDLVGRLLVKGINGEFKGVEFYVGSGFTEQERQNIWQCYAKCIGKQLTYTYQPCGSVDKPRIPIFKRFRPEE